MSNFRSLVENLLSEEDIKVFADYDAFVESAFADLYGKMEAMGKEFFIFGLSKMGSAGYVVDTGNFSDDDKYDAQIMVDFDYPDRSQSNTTSAAKASVILGLGLSNATHLRDRNYSYWENFYVAGQVTKELNIRDGEEGRSLEDVIARYGLESFLGMCYDQILNTISTNDVIKGQIFRHEFGHIFDGINREFKHRNHKKNYELDIKSDLSNEEYNKLDYVMAKAWYNTWDELEQIYREIASGIAPNVDKIDVENIRSYKELVEELRPYTIYSSRLDRVLELTEPKLQNKLFRKIIDFIKEAQNNE